MTQYLFNTAELRKIQRELETQGYDANIAEDLPDNSKNKLEQNIAIQISLSRFCVMIDKDPSGHIREYDIALNEDAVLARIIPVDGGSTQMIRENRDANNVKTFEYHSDPAKCLNEAINWAEEYVDQREKDNIDKWDWYEETDPTKSSN